MKGIVLLVICTLVCSSQLSAQKLLDSIVSYSYRTPQDSVRSWKEVSEYNTAGLKSSLARYSWDSRRNVWVAGTFPGEECDCPGKYEFTYDQYGNIILSYSFQWNWTRNRWGFKFKTENEFDLSGNLTSYFFSVWSESENKWIAAHAEEYSYDQNQHITQEIVYFPDITTEIWNPYQKEEYTYDNRGNKNQYILLDWVPDQRDWLNRQKSEWTYDSIGNPIVNSNSSWKPVRNVYQWVEESRNKTDYEYDTWRNPRSSTLYNWRFDNQTWVRNERTLKSFDSTGHLTRDIKYHWSSTRGAWVGNDSAEWVYDDAGHIISEARYNRSSGNLSDLHRFAKTDRTYDAMGDQTMETHFDWDPETKTFIRGPREFYYYQGSTNGIPGYLDDPIRMYPNPTEGILNITGLPRNSKIRIYSTLGILLKAFDSFDDQIDLGDLPAGMYFIHFVQVEHSPEILAIIKK